MRNKKFSSIGINLTDQVNQGKTYKTNRKITKIAVHCSFSPQNRGDDAHTIDQWHLEKKWSGIGYHYVILEDGTIQKGRWVDSMGAGIMGYNSYTIHICRIGGMAKDGTAKQDATPAQIKSIKKLSGLLVGMYDLKRTDILGHNEFPNVNKSCPLMNMNQIRNII